jgi:hypothetical protein
MPPRELGLVGEQLRARLAPNGRLDTTIMIVLEQMPEAEDLNLFSPPSNAMTAMCCGDVRSMSHAGHHALACTSDTRLWENYSLDSEAGLRFLRALRHIQNVGIDTDSEAGDSLAGRAEVLAEMLEGTLAQRRVVAGGAGQSVAGREVP